MGCCSLKNDNSKSKSPKNKAPNISKKNFVRLIYGGVNEYYKIIEKIGSGGFGQVRIGVPKNLNMKVAIKTILINQNINIDKLMEEVNVLKSLDHPNIIKIHEVILDSRSFNIVMELCTGGEMFDRIRKIKNFTENKAASYMNDLVSAIQFCHHANIVHRDLKPENILFENETEESRLKIIDFGTSVHFKPKEIFKRFVGTAYYVAPEVIDEKYNEKCDVWSLGVILYVMLCGKPPFNGKDDEEIFEKIKHNPVVFKDNIWNTITDNAKNLIIKMLIKDPEKRPSIDEVYLDPWIRNRVNKEEPDIPIASQALINLSNFRVIDI